MNLIKNHIQAAVISILLAVFPFITGLFFDWSVISSCIALAVFLTVVLLKNNRLNIIFSYEFISLFVIFCSGFTAAFFTDVSYRPFQGLVRLLALLLLALILMQFEQNNVLKYLPASGLIMLILSFILFLIPKTRDLVINGGRLIGPIGYANVTAFYFLICLILGSDSDHFRFRHKWIGLMSRIIFSLLMILGIMWTGSRMTVSLLVLVFIWIFIKRPQMRKVYAIVFSVSAVLFIAIYFFISDKTGFARFTTMLSDRYSSLIRLLYWKDALGQIKTHPLGQGYLSFYDLQGIFQTGCYSVRFIHNSFLECFFSYGWIAGAALIFLTVKGIIDAKGEKRLILIILAARCLVDFDLDFIAVCFIGISCMNLRKGTRLTVSLNNYLLRLIPEIITAVLVLCTISPCIASFFDYTEQPAKAAHICPQNYEYLLDSFNYNADTSFQKQYLFSVIKRNPHSKKAWLSLADIYLQDDNIDKVAECYTNAIRSSYFDPSVYNSLINFYRGYSHIHKNDERTRIRLLGIINVAEENAVKARDNSSAIGRKINVIPDFDSIINSLEEIKREL